MVAWAAMFGPAAAFLAPAGKAVTGMISTQVGKGGQGLLKYVESRLHRFDQENKAVMELVLTVTSERQLLPSIRPATDTGRVPSLFCLLMLPCPLLCIPSLLLWWLHRSEAAYTLSSTCALC